MDTNLLLTLFLKAPEFKVPEISAPKVEIPSFSAPKVEIPSFSAPKVDIPSFSAPKVDIPSFSVPSKVDVPPPKVSSAPPSFDLDKSSAPSEPLESQEVRDEKASNAKSKFKRLDEEAKVSYFYYFLQWAYI